LIQSAKQIRAEQSFQAIFQAMPCALLILKGPDGGILTANPFTYSWLGYRPEELGRMKIEDLAQPPLAEEQVSHWRRRDGSLVDIKQTLADITLDGEERRLVIAHDVTQLNLALEELKRLSLMDNLTRVANRRNFDEYLQRQWKLAVREESLISLIMADIDFFKRYNDSLGHQAGDFCLIRVATVLAGTARRPLDMVARWGGEEFALVLPDTDKEGALKVAAEIRQNLANLALPHPDSEVGEYVTVSLGSTTMKANSEENPEKLIALADQALYQAKAGGRNRVVHLDFT
jgi:diguanylate cyclase (GGDEF)-like protein